MYLQLRKMRTLLFMLACIATTGIARADVNIGTTYIPCPGVPYVSYSTVSYTAFSMTTPWPTSWAVSMVDWDTTQPTDTNTTPIHASFGIDSGNVFCMAKSIEYYPSTYYVGNIWFAFRIMACMSDGTSITVTTGANVYHRGY